MIKRVDYDQDGRIDFKEFVCMMIIQMCMSDKAKEPLVLVFNRFDKDGDGELNESDIMLLFQELGHDLDQ